VATIEFIGAAKVVTGSKHLLEAVGRRILIDCGLFQGSKKLRQRNWEPLPFAATSIDAVVLTHAHIDHTGYLPRFLSQGFTGEVYATPATVDLLHVLLEDSGGLQEEEARYRNRKGATSHAPALPLYTADEGRAAAKRAKPIAHGEPIDLGNGLTATYHRAGHIIGSAFVTFDFEENGTRSKVVFSGDIGRFGVPILPDPDPIGDADYVVTESTYGGRVHEHEPIADQLERVVLAAVERGGALIVPAFAIGRTQALMVHLNELELAGRIPCLPTFVDSPMAIDAYEIYSRHREDFDDKTWERLTAEDTPLRCTDFRLARSRKQSKAINEIDAPIIIISASGMVTGGRILHHMRKRLPDPRTTVLMVGYQAFGTRGHQLVSGDRTIRIFRDEVPVRATIEILHGMSAHAGSNELMRWLGTTTRAPHAAYAVYGEPDAAAALVARLGGELGWRASVPDPGDRVALEPNGRSAR
jgi:metallo-beta-lactamase family protein